VHENAVVVAVRSKGLMVPATITADRQGYAWAEGEEDFGTVFSLSLPMVYV
jgi:signal transduction histidine kinase